jgi:hypothetical protein
MFVRESAAATRLVAAAPLADRLAETAQWYRDARWL